MMTPSSRVNLGLGYLPFSGGEAGKITSDCWSNLRTSPTLFFTRMTEQPSTRQSTAKMI
jgi:hypothetical protein